MKKISIIAIAAALLLTACNNITDEKTDLRQSETIADVSQTENSAESTSAVFTAFKPGIWEGENQYYIFNDDLQSGSSISFSSGNDIGFNYYLIDDNQLIFCFAFDGDNSPAEITESSDDSVTLKWSDGIIETLKFVTSESEESFDFPKIEANAFTSFKTGI